MSMPIANQSVTEDVLPPVEGTESGEKFAVYD